MLRPKLGPGCLDLPNAEKPICLAALFHGGMLFHSVLEQLDSLPEGQTVLILLGLVFPLILEEINELQLRS